jgi:aspartate/methionine/tyrosine aminotransferase
MKRRTSTNFYVLGAWMAAQKTFEWVEPSGGAVCFPRFRSGAAVDLDRFYSILENELRTAVGPGHWFDEDRRHFRIGFGYPPEDEFVRGLEAIEKAANATTK